MYSLYCTVCRPDGVQRGLVGQIISRFETRGFFLRGMKMMQVEKSHAEKHYADLSSKGFFGALVDYMCSGPVVCMVWEGLNAVRSASIVFCDEESASFFVPTKHRSKRGA